MTADEVGDPQALPVELKVNDVVRQNGSTKDMIFSVAELVSHASRLMTLDAAHKIDAGDEARVEISALKFMAAKVLHDVIDRAVQTHGALGISGDSPLSMMYLTARFARIYDGPDEVHRMVVARRILKAFEAGEGWQFK